MKKLLLLIVIVLTGIFIYVKTQTLGDPNSKFNQTTRLALGEHQVLRTIFSLRSSGDARMEYLEGTGPIIIEWFAPETESIDPSVLSKFASLVSKYTGRQTEVLSGGPINDETVQLANLNSYGLQSDAETPSGTRLLVFFTEDYLPRPPEEISSTYQEDGMVLSLGSIRTFLQNYSPDTDQYLLSSMLHEFGNQIGMQETATGTPDCIMNLQAGINGQPLEAYDLSEPQDFCPSEQVEIQNIKAQLSNLSL